MAALIVAVHVCALGACASTQPGAVNDSSALGQPVTSAAKTGRQSAKPAPSAAPIDLAGLSPQDVRSALGVPALVRREEGAEVWQYPSQSCVLLIYLYDDAGSAKVRYVEALSPDAAGGPVATEPCVAERMVSSSSS